MAFRCCEAGRLEPQIERLRAIYRERRDAMLDGLAAELSGIARWTRPAGGMFLLLELPADRDAAALLDAALARGIVFVPGAAFYPAGGGRHTLRLNFISEPPDRIRRGLRILKEVLSDCVV